MENELIRLAEFKSVLENYAVSEHSKQILSNTRLVMLVGPTSSGRNTIIEKLVTSGEYHYIVSDTTRKKRKNNGVMEEDGRQYWFRSETQVLNDLKAGKFLEAALIHSQQVSGISIRELVRAQAERKIALADVEIVGVDNIMAEKPDAFAIFVLPPSFTEWQQRLHRRSKMSRVEIRRRLGSAVEEFEHALAVDYYYFLTNSEVQRAVDQVNTIVRGAYDQTTKTTGRQLATQLLEDTKLFLRSY